MQGFPTVGPPDLAQLQSTMHAIEQACSAIEMNVNLAAAETIIVALHQSSRPYISCKFILENSQLPNARFQAAGAIRDAALREWGHLMDEERRSLINFCLQYVMEHATATDAYVQAKVSAVAAQLLKRGWLEFDAAEKEVVFNEAIPYGLRSLPVEEVKNAVLGIHGLEAQFAGLNFLESLVSEFAPSTSSAMGLPTEFHDQCRSLLEVNYLKGFYCWAQDTALRITDKVIGKDASIGEDKVCSASLRLMFQILSWDFKHSNESNSKSSQDITLLKKFERALVQPGPAWSDILITSGHISWLLSLYGALRKKFLYDVLWFDSPIAVSSRQLIVQLCSLTGTIFSSDNGHTQEKYLLQILDAIVQWMYPPDMVIAAIKNGQSESEMLDGCHALLSIATICSTMMFDNLLKAQRPYGTLHLLSVSTSEVVKVASEKDQDESWCSEALDILLETWNILLLRVDSDGNTLSAEGKVACATLFNLIMESQLKVAADSAYDEDNDCDHFHASVSSRDEMLNSYALIARTAADFTLPLLLRHFSERVSLIRQEKGRTDPTRTLEELYWLLLMSGHILADSGEGETALVPESLQVHFAGVSDASQHPVVVLSWEIINFSERCLDADMRAAFFSPRLLEAVVWFLARWADTYLMPSELTESHHSNPVYKNQHPQGSNLSSQILHTFAGEGNQGKNLLDTLVRIAITTLISYPGEAELQTLTCRQLLPVLVRRRNVCGHLVKLDSWHSLSNAFANDRILLSLASRLQRFLAETLVRSASAIDDSNSSNQFVRDLMGPMVTYLLEMSSKNDLKATAQQPDAMLSITCLLERLRGATRATEPRTQKPIFDMALAVMNPLLIFMDIYKDEAAVTYMILKFGVDLVDGQVIFLSPKDTAVLIGFCMRMLQIYSAHNVRKISLSLSAGLLREAKTEKYKDLRALLQLLTNLCTKDLVDFSSATEGEGTDIAQVVYMGLHTVLPLMSLELLKYPKLSYQYFSLLSHMLEVYPEKVAQLNVEGFSHIIGTLDWGIRQQDLEVVSMCLQAVDALASYHYKERSAGKEGLGGHADVVQDPSGKSVEGILRHFLRLLMQLLLFEDFSPDLHGAAADALFPLLLCEQDLFQSSIHELIKRQTSEALKSRLANAFKGLTSSNQLAPSLDRINRQRFRKNFYKFFVDVSGFLRTK